MKLLFLVLCTVAVLVESHDSSLVLSVSNSQSTSDSWYPLVISCKGLLSAVPLFWTGPNGKHITYSSKTEVHASILTKEIRLQINDLEEKDHGIYICHGLDGIGNKIEVSFALPNKGAPFFEKASVEVNTEEGQNVTLICQAEGDPTPVNKWFDKMSAEITSSSHPVSKFRIGTTSLTICNLEIEDSGFYSCLAENSHGSASMIFVLNVTKPLENGSDVIVRNITVMNVTEDSVTFGLSFDETDEPTFIRARYWTPRNSNMTHVRWAKGDKYSVQNLDSGVKYFFQFSVMLSQTAGNWSTTISVTLPPGAPEIVFRKIGDRSLTLEWSRNYECVELFNGTLDHYRIKYRTVEIKGGNQWEYRNNCEVSVTIPNCFGSQYQISGLMENTYYEIKVQTHNSAGYGKPTTFKIRM